MRKTTDTKYVEVIEVTPSLGANLDEMKYRCKYVKIVSECEYSGYYIIPVNGLNRTNKGIWVAKSNLLSEVKGIEFNEVTGYLDKNKKEYDGYIPGYIDIRLRRHK